MSEHIWTRREGESPVAHDAFKIYLHQGKDRSTRSVAEACAKNESLIKRWSSTHDWPARSVAYDAYVLEASTDGLVHDIAQSRDEILSLMGKLRGLLDMCLDDHIKRREPPTVRWSQAATVMARVQQNFLLLKDDAKTDARIVRIEELVERALQDPVKP